MPPVSEAQRAAMHAAKAGKSTLGIPKSVGQEFVAADPGGKLPKKKSSPVNYQSMVDRAKKYLLPIVLLLLLTSSAGAVDCFEQPGDSQGQRWSWRTVDNKKCWYQGRPQLPREQLAWPAPAPAPEAPETQTQDEPTQSPVLPEYLPLPPPSPFRNVDTRPAIVPKLGDLMRAVSLLDMRPIPDSFDMRFKGAPK